MVNLTRIKPEDQVHFVEQIVKGGGGPIFLYVNGEPWGEITPEERKAIEAPFKAIRAERLARMKKDYLDAPAPPIDDENAFQAAVEAGMAAGLSNNEIKAHLGIDDVMRVRAARAAVQQRRMEERWLRLQENSQTGQD